MGRRNLAVIIASFCMVLIGFGVRTGYGVLLPEMLPSLRMSKTEAGLIYGSFFIAYTVFSPVLGLLADRINTRSLLTLFSVILGIGTLLMGYSSSLLEATFFFMVAGIGSSACWSPVVPLVQRWASDQRRGMTLAFVDVGASVGVALTSLVIPFIVVAYNWRMGWKALGILALIVAGINYLLVRDSPGEQTKFHEGELRGPQNEAFSRIYGRILRDGKFLLIGTSYLLIGFSTLIPLTFVSTYAVQELMFRYDVATRMITTIAVASMVGKLVLGHLSDSLGRIRAIIICQVLIAMGTLGIVYFPKFLAINLSMAIFGFGHGAIWPLYALCAPDFFSKSQAGFIVGLWTLFLGIGLILSPIIAGWVADVTGTFMWSFALAIATAMISSFLLLLGGKKNCFSMPSR